MSGHQACLARLKQTSKADTLSWLGMSHTHDAATHMYSIDWWCQYHLGLGTKHDQAAADSQLVVLRSFDLCLHAQRFCNF